MGNLLVSIVMPAYNCERYIAQAVMSVKEQTYKNWELIIIDDCSFDDTWAVAVRLADCDERIRVFQNEENYGVGKTRNLGVGLSNGNWIAFLDSDDMWEPDKLEKQIALLSRKPDIRLIFTGSSFMSESGNKIPYILHVPELVTRRQLFKQNVISSSSVLVNREYMEKYPMSERGDMHEDFLVWLQILQETCAYGIDEPLLIYRISAGSKSGNKLKAAKMNWNTYCAADISRLSCIYNMCWYAVRGLLKYFHIKKHSVCVSGNGDM